MSVQFISTNKNYKRLYASPLDPTISWNTEEEMLNYLTDPTCYVNQIMGCNGKAYIVIETEGIKDVKEIGTLGDITTINKELSEVKETALSNKDNIDSLNDKFDSKINSKFDDVIVDSDKNLTKLIFMAEGNEVKNIEFESGSGSCSGSGIDDRLFIGESEPTETEEVLVWIDTSNNDNEYTGGLNDLVIEEFRGMFNYLKEQIQELKAKNLDLEARILYLEENGGGTIKPDKPITPSGATIMAIEDGSILIDENGDILVFEFGDNNESNDSNDIIMTTENNEILINEENKILIF